MKKSFFYLLIMLLIPYITFAQDDSTSDREGLFSFEEKKLSMEIREHYDPVYPLNVRDFYFYQGDKRITLEEFEKITNDELLKKNKQKIKSAKIGGATGAGLLGGLTLSFLIPSIVFITLQTNYQNIPALRINPDTGEEYQSWLEYYEKNYHTQFLPGLIFTVLTAVSCIGLIIDLTVMFALIYKYKNNYRLYQDVLERYNNKLKEKYSLLPELGFNTIAQEQLNLSLGVKINL